MTVEINVLAVIIFIGIIVSVVKCIQYFFKKDVLITCPYCGLPQSSIEYDGCYRIEEHYRVDGDKYIHCGGSWAIPINKL